MLSTIFTIWALIYYALAFKRMYGGTWSETIARGALLAAMYILTFLVLGLLVTAVLLPADAAAVLIQCGS